MSLLMPGTRPFQDRSEAGRVLAGLLRHYAGREDVVVLGLPRGGVPVAYEVARALNAPLDVLVVRKLGVPGHCELAMGAIAGGVRVLNDDVVKGLGIPDQVIEAVATREQQELERRENSYRDGRTAQQVHDRIVILVDDGLATGSTMHAAVSVVRRQQPARVIVAVPTAARQSCEEFTREVGECICAITPEPFHAVGLWYEDFATVTDAEVCALLKTAANEQAGPRALRGPAQHATH